MAFSAAVLSETASSKPSKKKRQSRESVSVAVFHRLYWASIYSAFQVAVISMVIIPVIDFQIKFLDCVISRPPSTTYYLHALLRGAPSSPLKEDQKHYLKAYR